MNILDILVEKKILEKDKAAEIASQAKSSNQTLEEVILAQRILDEESLFSLKSEAFKIPLRKVDAQEVPLKVLELIPEDSAKYYKMVPIAQEKDLLEIGMVYPDDLNAKEALKFLAHQGNFRYQTFLITPSTFEGLMKQSRNLKGEMTKALSELDQELNKKNAGYRENLSSVRVVEEAPVTKIVAVMLRTAVEGGASDIHIEPTKEKLRVRFRFLGELHSSLLLPIKIHPAIIARIKILSSMRIDETRIPQDGRFSTVIDSSTIDFRVSTFPTALGEKIAIRVLDPSKGLQSFDQLGLEGLNLVKLKEAIKKPFGLLLVTGPTGSGKTTTLYSVLHILNREGVNIVSLEDPVEYVIEGVNQSQIKPEIGYDFASGLREILRQDPDIIMVGEVRDNETATLVTHSALTGHIVLSTLHTNNAVGVVPRLLDMGIDKYLIPATLAVAISQRLVRRLCDGCKQKEKVAKAVSDLIQKEVALFPEEFKKQAEPFLREKDLELFRPRGCKKCGQAGFTGRIAVFEVLAMTDELGKIVVGEPSEGKIAEEARRQGMTTMRQDGILKVLDGITILEEVIRVTEE